MRFVFALRRAVSAALIGSLALITVTSVNAQTAPGAARPTKPKLTPLAVVDPGDGGGSTTTRVPTFFEQGIVVRSGEVIRPLGPNLMGDTLGEYSGGLAFRHTDVALPGNNALPVEVGRHLAVGTRQAALMSGLFGDWDLEIPRLHTVAFQDKPDWYGRDSLGNHNLNRCSQLALPPSSSYTAGNKMVGLNPGSWFSGYQLYVPGVGDQTLFRRLIGNGPANPIQPTDGGAYPVLTKQHWQVSCLPGLERGTGEGFVARAPDGTRYQFDHMVRRSYPSLDTFRYGQVARIEIWILPTLVTDRFGNWVRYTYAGTDGWRVTSITASDGRAITLTYSGWGNRIQSVSNGTGTWTYGYDAGGALQTVTQPDGSRWRFALGELERDPFSIEDPGCGSSPNARWDPYTRVGTITHPSGAVGSFGLKMTMHGRTNVPGSEEACEGPYYVNGLSKANLVSRYFATYALVVKTLSGPGLPAMTWAYAYSPAYGSFAPCNGCAGSKTVTITDPQGQVTQRTYGTQFGINDGLLLSSSEGNGSAVLRTTVNTYRAPGTGPGPILVGYEGSMSESMGAVYTPLVQRTITQQDVTFTQAVSGFDVYARATSLTRSSSLGYRRSESTTYYDQPALWVLGQVSAHIVSGVQAESTSFNGSTALPAASYKFGKLESNYTFNPDGTLARVTDGRNQSTTFTNYKRGLPQNIGYADGTSISGVVNNLGALTSITNEAGTTWAYGYDTMGRLTSKTPPSDGTEVYHPTVLAFEQVPTTEYGLEPSHWRQTIVTGNAVTVNYFDARWRKRLTMTYDAANRNGTERAQRFDYDPYNRTTFASYPARSISSVSTALPGTTSAYDALGRPTVRVADSELGPLTSTTQYLSGFKTRVTNARGQASTEAYQAYDAPSQDLVVSITMPEGVSVAIERDPFGKPVSITRGGAGMAVTRRYVYDGYHQLCKTIEPESGATVQSHDAAGNLQWRASGLALPSTATCDQASVPAARVVSHGYDPRNRLINTSHGDGSAGVGRSYTPDGLPLQVWSAGTTWTYGYNNRRKLTSEVLSYAGTNYAVGWGTDAYGDTASLVYPDGAVLAYAPNALGAATQVSDYANTVTYHPNGALAGYNLTNGIAHSVQQNTRGLPQIWRDAGVLQDSYAYDANGNVLGIADQQEGVSSRSLGYDGLDRLTTANGVWGAGSFGYDALDNLRNSTVGTRVINHQLDPASNRLAAMTGSVNLAIAYDPNGNVTQRGVQAFTFDIGNRLQSAAGKASYTYDGHGRRVRALYADGSWKLQFYSQSGKLLFTQHSSQGNTRHIYLGDRLIAENGSAGFVFIHTDALGSPVARTNAWGGLISRTRYEPYGATAAGANPTSIGFTGHVNDADTGLVYMQQRYYDPIAGRFLSVDPVTTSADNGGSFNRFSYVNSNPYRYIDPDGREKSDGGGFGYGWETVSNFVDTTVTGGFGLQFKQAANAGNYGEAGLKLAAGVAVGALNVATLGEGSLAVAAVGKGIGLAAKGVREVLILGRREGLEQLAREEGGRLSLSSSISAKEVYKQNSRDIRSADRIIFNERGVPRSAEEAARIQGGEFARAERELILSRQDLMDKTTFINR